MDVINDSLDMSLSKLQEMVKDTEAWGAAAHGVTKTMQKYKGFVFIILLIIFIF